MSRRERMAADIGELAEAMGCDRDATLGHSDGAEENEADLAVVRRFPQSVP